MGVTGCTQHRDDRRVPNHPRMYYEVGHLARVIPLRIRASHVTPHDLYVAGLPAPAVFNATDDVSAVSLLASPARRERHPLPAHVARPSAARPVLRLASRCAGGAAL